ncbi:uncharacterized protein LOC131619270 [Vicia villosa]|uniref:uncharacterized protein LOC131619270 n=1 Tax=Vicia villosa TaxID=3911 RepID=UPI00273C6845|nr:uncharacterized protein LOC131619270 [Vicia villosa]
MSDRPWFIYDHYLTVKEWTPDFHPENDSIVNVAVWIRISGLSVEYYDPKVLHVIGNLVGRTVKVDKNTLQSERGKCARICVEVDISKPLLAMFELKNKSYRIEFEGLHLLCITCGKFGHYKEGCPMKKNVDDKMVNSDSQKQNVDMALTMRNTTEEGKALGDDGGETSGIEKESINGDAPVKENYSAHNGVDMSNDVEIMEKVSNDKAINKETVGTKTNGAFKALMDDGRQDVTNGNDREISVERQKTVTKKPKKKRENS